MKRLLFLLFPVCIYSWLIVCITYSKAIEADQVPATEIQTASVASDLHLDPYNAKWQADEYTSASIENMQQILEVFTNSNNIGSLKAYQELGKNLNSEIKTLFRQCTMSGPAHKELHTFLTPVLQDVKTLQGNDLKASTTAHLRLEEQLSVYQAFFE